MAYQPKLDVSSKILQILENCDTMLKKVYIYNGSNISTRLQTSFGL
jgi:hypothetical protein